MNLQQIVDRLVEDEGERLFCYQDHLGFWTIGVGRLIDKRKNGGISVSESRFLLDSDINRASNAARVYKWFDGLDDARQGVIVCMIFQLGAAGFAKFKATHAAIEARDYELAAQRMLASLWATQTPERARRLAEIMRTGVWT